jgi:hypothetical protein
MDRNELIALRDALNAILDLPVSVFNAIAALRANAKATGNGADPDPLPPVRPSPVARIDPGVGASKSKPRKAAETKPRPQLTPKQLDRAAEARAEEAKLLDLMASNEGATIAELAELSHARTTTVSERCRRLHDQNLIEKAEDGRWRIVGGETANRPTIPP